jgi:hypothetical protein
MSPSSSPTPPHRPDASVRGAHEWLVLSDALLAGLVHTLNNRVTAISVCTELAIAGDSEAASSAMMSAELHRLQRVCALLGQLPMRGLAPEALELVPMLDDAIALHAHHQRLRTVDCAIELKTAVQPVRAPRWALLRLFLILLEVAKEAAVGPGESSVTLEVSGDERAVSVRTRARLDLGSYGEAMAEACGASVTRENDELVITLPSLHELRRGERAARANG